jgi:hypothetical protein
MLSASGGPASDPTLTVGARSNGLRPYSLSGYEPYRLLASTAGRSHTSARRGGAWPRPVGSPSPGGRVSKVFLLREPWWVMAVGPIRGDLRSARFARGDVTPWQGRRTNSRLAGSTYEPHLSLKQVSGLLRCPLYCLAAGSTQFRPEVDLIRTGSPPAPLVVDTAVPGPGSAFGSSSRTSPLPW